MLAGQPLVSTASVATEPLDLTLALTSASPLALGTGALLGPSVAADLRLDHWRLGLRVYLGMASENDLTWDVAHTEIRAAARGGLALPWGRGELGLGLSAGVLTLLETRTRHQAERLDEAGIDTSRSAAAAGPFVALDSQVRLIVFDPWAVSLSVGPTLSWLALGETTEWVVGWSGSIGVAYAVTP